MPRCQKCKTRFPNRIQLDGKTRNICNRKFCLECSPFGEHNTKDITKSTPTHRVCSLCKRSRRLKFFYKRKSPDRFGQPHAYCQDCTNRYSQERQRKIKLLAIEYRGGKCVDCGYNKYAGALDFHHRDPKEKKFKIAGRTSLAFGPELKNELDKCDLLCANCHRERHAKEAI